MSGVGGWGGRGWVNLRRWAKGGGQVDAAERPEETVVRRVRLCLVVVCLSDHILSTWHTVGAPPAFTAGLCSTRCRCAYPCVTIVSGEAAAFGLWVSVGGCGMSVSVAQGVAKVSCACRSCLGVSFSVAGSQKVLERQSCKYGGSGGCQEFAVSGISVLCVSLCASTCL